MITFQQLESFLVQPWYTWVLQITPQPQFQFFSGVLQNAKTIIFLLIQSQELEGANMIKVLM